MEPLLSSLCFKVPILTQHLKEELISMLNNLVHGNNGTLNNKEMETLDSKVPMENISASTTVKLFVIETHLELGNNSNSDEIAEDK
jgi:hypothetical protein